MPNIRIAAQKKAFSCAEINALSPSKVKVSVESAFMQIFLR
jgi:hypothetical protein